MKHLLKDIKKELEAICPQHLRQTKQYATQKEIDEFQQESRLQFPAELIEFWLTCDFEITTGTGIYKELDCEMAPSFCMFEEFEYLLAYWQENAGHEFDESFDKGSYYHFKNRGFKEEVIIKKVFDKGWFPIAIDSFDGAICVDLNPGSKGKKGQLLYMIYAGDDKSGPYYMGFDSLSTLLSDYLQQLKERKIEIEDNIVYPLTHF